MRFADFLDEPAAPLVATDGRAAPAQPEPSPSRGATSPHHHVLGPPPSSLPDVSAFAELFGPPPSSAPEVAIAVQTAVDAIVVDQPQTASHRLPNPPDVKPAVPRTDIPTPAFPTPAIPTPTVPVIEIAATDAVAIANIAITTDDDLLPHRSKKVRTTQPTRAWSRGRSNR